ncbi:MAG TPA: hypothetical protein VN922_23795, partial [Bacteroidia bacterium]|nr:hypothetical protein [Bacteroidia bacterium]
MKMNMHIVAGVLAGGLLLNPLSSTSSFGQAADSAAAEQPFVNQPQGGSEKFLLAGEVFTLWQNNQVHGLPSTNSFGADPLGLMLMPLV